MNVLHLRPSLAHAQLSKYVKQSTHLGHIHEDALHECDAKPREVGVGATLYGIIMDVGIANAMAHNYGPPNHE